MLQEVHEKHRRQGFKAESLGIISGSRGVSPSGSKEKEGWLRELGRNVSGVWKTAAIIFTAASNGMLLLGCYHVGLCFYQRTI